MTPKPACAKASYSDLDRIYFQTDDEINSCIRRWWAYRNTPDDYCGVHIRTNLRAWIAARRRNRQDGFSDH